jgi:hypothetical protein
MAREKDRTKQTAHPKKRAIDRYEHADKNRVDPSWPQTPLNEGEEVGAKPQPAVN